MITPRRVGHATFETPDLDKALAYYTEVNGLVLNSRDKDRAYLASKTGLLTIALERGRDAGLRRISFEVSPKADVADMARKLAADHQCFGAGPLKLGHIAYVVEDPQAIADFYCRVLGFRVSDWIEDFFVFLRCNPDHDTPQRPKVWDRKIAPNLWGPLPMPDFMRDRHD